MTQKNKTYYVRWILENGVEYRATSGCTWEYVLKCKKLAKDIGETIKYEVENY